MQFFSLVLLATSALAIPTKLPSRATAPTCMEKGTKVSSWNLSDFVYKVQYSSEKRTNTATVAFDLHNAALDYSASCSGKVVAKNADKLNKKDLFDGKTDYNCKVPNGADSASFKYNHKKGVIAISQHWACVQEGGWFEATGNKTSGASMSDCKTTSKKGAEYETCTKASIKVPVLEMRAVL
ncbi:sscrp protein [Fusarium flagelliforme]|uniref:Sscrp protein n=1 Tax=Fusarium flagelliforme TaxID=2675880 RepID=A0A395N0J5_9HYPO|nr:sscrp protein [Fusarium flagelliforme]